MGQGEKPEMDSGGAAAGVEELLRVMEALRAEDGCPWDRQQDHHSLRHHAVEEVYELLDAIEAGDEEEMIEELGDLLLQVVFHAQIGRERGRFSFADVAHGVAQKLIRRHPHVFGEARVDSVDGVWAQWEQIKRSEKEGTERERRSALEGIPKSLPALMRAEKLIKKARKAGLLPEETGDSGRGSVPPGDDTRQALGEELFELVFRAQRQGWSAEALLRETIDRKEAAWREQEGSTNH